MDRTSFIALVCGTALALGVIYVEKYGTLQLPGPSFRSVGPVHKTPPLPPQEGIYAPNSDLHKAEHRFKGEVHGCETLTVSPAGDLYMSDKYGNIYKAKANQKKHPELIAHLGGGRPLGIAVNEADDVFVCLSNVGLVHIPKGSKYYTVLVTQAPENMTSSRLTPLFFPNSLAIASNGDIYFSDSLDMPPPYIEKQYYDTLGTYYIGILESRAPGRLLKYSQKDQSLSIITDGLAFANGVQLASDESFVLVTDTTMSQLIRIWLKGPKAGTKDIFFDQVPGFPDGLARGKDDTYWISVVAFDQPDLKTLLNSRIAKWFLPKLPEALTKPKPGTAVIQVSKDGKVLRYMADPDDSHIGGISSVSETDKGLFIGNVGDADHIAFLPSALYSKIL